MLNARQAQRSATEQSDRFRYAFAKVPRRDLAIGLQAFSGMSEQHVRQFMKPRLVQHRIHRIDGNRPTASEPQDIAVRLVEGNFGDV